MSSDPAIRVRDLGKRYLIYDRPQDRLRQMLSLGRPGFGREFWALRAVDLEIATGSCIGLVGRNGAGKSTLLQLLAGTVQPSTGFVETRGRLAALLELGSGFNPEFTGRENLVLAATVLGLDEAEIRARTPAIEAFADIGAFIDQPVKHYSSGMQARLAFAVSAHVDPSILLLDETLAVGDAAFTQKCMRAIHAFRERGTLIIASHDMAAITALADRVLWLDGGRVREDGDPRTVCEHYLASVYGSDTAAAAPGRRIAAEPRFRPTVAAAEVQPFEPAGDAFGEGAARIVDAVLTDPEGRPLARLEGGEAVCLSVTAAVTATLDQPLIGFIVKDRMGQELFGENTLVAPRRAAPAGSRLVARFSFVMPWLRAGDYAVTIAVGDGTQTAHRQHHWLHEALIFRIATSSVTRGLAGVPMLDVSLAVEGAD
ncbi:ABC transporter ATP-binding protein [Zavarzinia sp. CC-PAN008]|uniref:ABC transporter ATP-binding protein n=1 Tax=Zavarzinia sp. CC-PAN008 TaxID=3243332 RepID=UPI003F7469AD